MSKRNTQEKRIQRVREAFDPEVLIGICEQPQSAFVEYADFVPLAPVKGWRKEVLENFYFFKDNGAPILFVAHLDNVQWDRTTRYVPDAADGPIVLSGALDDRLGAYVGLDLFPKLGINCDILLTTNEECGQSSAQEFETNKQYNWMIEFDRMGTDVVMYQYDTKANRELVRACGAHVGNGSYSDIADLEHLNCAGFNWGVGYEDYHSKRGFAWLNDTFKMVAKFMKFYQANATIHLEHDYVPWTSRYSGTATATVVKDCPLCPGYLDEDGCCWGCGYGIKEIYGEDYFDGDPEAAKATDSDGAKEEAG